MSLPAVSIIIPTLGEPEKLQRLLASAQRQKFLGTAEAFEVVVVVNGVKAQGPATEGSIKTINVSEKGVNIARNAGLKEAKAAIVLFLDDDCELHEPYFLARHIRFHAEHPTVFATGGGYQLPANSGRFDEIYNAIQMRWFFSGLLQPGQNETTRYLLGGNFSIKARLAIDHGLLFDDQIKYGGSESEFFRKSAMLGLELRTNSFDVLHHTRETLLSLSRKLYKQGRGKALIDAKYPEVNAEVDPTPATEASHFVFNYIFWYGYYSYRKKHFRILKHILNDGISAFNAARFRILAAISRRLAEKKDKGDRF